MSSTPVYRRYGQAALDAQYNNRAKVADFDAVIRGWAEGSAAFRARAKGRLDLAYGTGERETLDLFPAGRPGAPLHVFLHGGYWQAMDKALFHFTGEALHRCGAHGAFINYPLAPQATLDAIVSACRRSIAWLWTKGPELVGNIPGIFVSGHSAGGHLTAMVLATDWERICPGAERPVLLGGCSLSGLFDLEPLRLSYLNGVLGLDRETAARNSPLLLEPHCRGPLLLVTGSLESDEYQRQSESLKARWQALVLRQESYAGQDNPPQPPLTRGESKGGVTTRKKADGALGVDVSLRVVPGADHFTLLESLTDPNSPVARAVLQAMGLATPP